MLGKARRGSLIHSGEKPGIRVRETRGSIRKVLVGVRDPGRYPEFLCGCKRPGEISRISVWVYKTRGDIRNFCVGVRDPWRYLNFCVGVKDPWRYPKFLCGCKRPVVISKISVWV